MKSVYSLLVAAALGAGFIGCSKSASTSGDSGPTAAALTIAGTLGAASLQSYSDDQFDSMSDNSAFAVTLSDLELYAICFTSPPAIATASVANNGAFSVSIPGAKGSACTMIFRDKNDQTEVGTVKFEDTSKKDLNGNNKKSTSVVLTDNVSLGNITLAKDGTVSIPITQISSSTSSDETVPSGTAFDFSGVWYMKAYDGTLPTGYQTVNSTCGNGPCIGFPVTLVRMAGKAFTPNSCSGSGASATCPESAGTVGTDDVYALSIWGGNYSSSIGACGGKMGFTADEVRLYGRLTGVTLPAIGGNTPTFGPYVYTSTGFGGDASPFNLPWMKNGAISTRSIQDCRAVMITKVDSSTVPGFACKQPEYSGTTWGAGTPTGTHAWQVSVQGGGCTNTDTGKPVNVTNWGAIGYGSCTPVDVTSTYGAGFFSSTCVYSGVDPDGAGPLGNINLTCTHTGGTFTNVSNAPSTTPYTYGSNHLESPVNLVNANSTCASIYTAGGSTTASKLLAYQCYAEAYWNNSSSAGGCARDYHFNYGATNPADFAKDDDRGKPKNAFITNVLTYAADGLSSTLEDESSETVQISTGPGSTTGCEVSRRTTISVKKISASRLLFDLKQNGVMRSTAAACQAAGKAGKAGTYQGQGDLNHLMSPQNMMFYLDSTN